MIWPKTTDHPQKIMRASGVRDVPIYCRDHRCSHHVEINADRWPDHIRPSDIALSFTCTACGKRGADKSPGQKAGFCISTRPR